VAHLDTAYGTLTIEDLEDNRDKIKADWNPDSELEHLWTRAMTCKTFAEGTVLALTDEAIMNLLLIPLEKTKVFPDDIKAWRIMPPANQTWTAFKEHFETRNKERTRHLSTGTAGYNALSAALVNLTCDPAPVIPHSANNATSTPPHTPPDGRRPAPQVAADMVGSIMKMYYCHSCGLGPYKNHTSLTCARPKPGHKKEATLKNLMGGNLTFYTGRDLPRNTPPRAPPTSAPTSA
jgi:hypothetical protein